VEYGKMLTLRRQYLRNDASYA